MLSSPIRLGINIDHVATVRNARGGTHPDPVAAARMAIEAGAHGITAHLREDRRHIRDRDIARLAAEIEAPLNFEMAATDEMVTIAIATKPHACCLVPERREEVTTEGGLDVAAAYNTVAPQISRLKDAGIRVSLFIDPSLPQIEAAARLSVPVIELHTGTYCHAVERGDARTATAELARLAHASRTAHALGIEVHAGHGLNFATAAELARLPEVRELNIGHFIVGEAIFLGLPETIKRLLAAINRGIVLRS